MELKELLDYNGDSIVTYRSPVSGKLRYTACTTDFSTPHIKKVKKPSINVKQGEVLVFCWDSDAFKKLSANTVTSVVPLSAVLKNER